MIVLRINDAEIPTGWLHAETEWQVSTSQDFTNIIAESLHDGDNLTSKVFNNKLDIGSKYYARARMLLNTGFTKWSNIDAFYARDINEVVMNMDMPSIISAPSLHTNFPTEAHPNAGFIIYTSDFATLGNADHVATSWIIEDFKGKTIWSSIDNSHELTEIRIKHLLPVHDVLYIRVAHVGSNGDVSQFGSMSIRTVKDEQFRIRTIIGAVYADKPLFVDVNDIFGLDSLEWELYIDDGALVAAETLYDVDVVIEEPFLEPNVNYILRMRATVNSDTGVWTYFYFTTLDEDLELGNNDDVPYVGEDELEYLEVGLPYKFRSYK